MITVGSPLAHSDFDVKDLRGLLSTPPVNLQWWVNFYNSGDLVPTGRGASLILPWVLDIRLERALGPTVHHAVTYVRDEKVVQAIGYGLFGSQSTDLVVADRGLDIPLDQIQTMSTMALRFAHIVKDSLQGNEQARYAEALRQSQGETIDRLIARAVEVGRPIPTSLVALKVDLRDPDSVPAVPQAIRHLSKDDAIIPLIAIAYLNPIEPYEIKIPRKTLESAFEELTIEMGLGQQLGKDLVHAKATAEKVLAGNTGNWIKWASLGVGAAAVLATGGLALAAAPAGLAGGVAIVSGLAAFGPGGMIGGLLTAGALVSVGSGGIAAGLASPAASAAEVEAIVSTQLAEAILRQSQGYEQSPSTWDGFTQMEVEIRRQKTRLEAISDKSAPTIKEIRQKLTSVERALDYLTAKNLAPSAK